MSEPDYDDYAEVSEESELDESGPTSSNDQILRASRARPTEGGANKLGRPTNCTPEVTATVVRYVTRGLPVRTAAAAAGISRRVISLWIARGKNGEEPYATFAEAVELAKAEFTAVHAGVVDDAGRMGDWKASAWLLERRTSAFVKREKVESKTEHSGAIEVEIHLPDNGRGR